MERYTRLSPDAQVLEQHGKNTFRFVFSDESVGRDNHRVMNRGIDTANFEKNPIILWAHDDQQPPIGSGSNIDTSAVKCRLDVQFVPRDTYEFAGVIRDLVEGGWLRALSMSWRPVEFKYSMDSNRRGGIDFTQVELLEISVVPLPALADALLDARSRGVNTRPLYEWTERRLDAGRFTSANARLCIEAIHRAARPVQNSRAGRPERAKRLDLEARLDRDERVEAMLELRSGGRAERIARLREIHALAPELSREERLEEAREIVRRIAADDAEWITLIRRRLLAKPGPGL